MATYLDTSKIQATGRLSLSPAALRNLNVDTGDLVEIFFDERAGSLLIVPVKNKTPSTAPSSTTENSINETSR